MTDLSKAGWPSTAYSYSAISRIRMWIQRKQNLFLILKLQVNVVKDDIVYVLGYAPDDYASIGLYQSSVCTKLH